MGFWNNIENDLRRHSEAVREERRQRANDQRIAQGQAPTHCGSPASTNDLGDYVCGRCGEIGF